MFAYKKREEAIPFYSKTRLIGLPILYSILLMLFVPVMSIGIIAGVIYLINIITGSDMPLIRKEPVSLYGTIQMILTIFISGFIILKVSRIKLMDLGLDFKNAFSKILKGLIGGFIAISLVVLLINLVGGVQTTYVFKSEYIGSLLLGMVFFAFQGTYEELVFRGYLIPHFSKAMGIIGSIILSSFLFMALHGLNPGMTTIPIINLFLAGVVFGIVYYYSGNLLVVGFAHAIWNYAQGFIYGSNVSGLNLNASIFKSPPITNDALLSGGKFGFEGSIITTIVGVVITIVFVFLIRKKGAVKL